jgi:hypothetical protein
MNEAIQLEWENFGKRASDKLAKDVVEVASYTTTKSETTFEDYIAVLRAIGAGLSLPGQIISITRIPWLTTMRCLRTLEQIGLVSTSCEADSPQRFSKLTEKGYDLLSEIISLT